MFPANDDKTRGQYYETNFYLKTPNFYIKFQKSLKDFENYLGKFLLLHKKVNIFT